MFWFTYKPYKSAPKRWISEARLSLWFSSRPSQIRARDASHQLLAWYTRDNRRDNKGMHSSLEQGLLYLRGKVRGRSREWRKELKRWKEGFSWGERKEVFVEQGRETQEQKLGFCEVSNRRISRAAQRAFFGCKAKHRREYSVIMNTEVSLFSCKWAAKSLSLFSERRAETKIFPRNRNRDWKESFRQQRHACDRSTAMKLDKGIRYNFFPAMSSRAKFPCIRNKCVPLTI